jgi:dihydroorotase
MNEGTMSVRLGIWGIPSISEEITISRDIMLASYTGARIHIAHVSTAGSVRIIREAKKLGVQVTCETCPHYLALTEDYLVTYNTNFKMNPPLRTMRDREALIEGLADGTIDVIASDHAPHVPEEKDVEFNAASFGIIGLETSLAVIMTYLVHKDILLPSELVEKMSLAPNRILGLPGGTLSPGSVADIAIINPNEQWTVQPDDFFSKARNTPFAGYTLRGFVQYTILGGSIVYNRMSIE